MQVVNPLGTKRVGKAQGKHIWIDGKKCLDFSLCASVNILGNSHKVVRRALSHQIRNGLSYGIPSDTLEKYLDVATKYIPFQHLAFCNTGSEAVMRAFRIARAYTGKRKIVIFEGCWHGSYDDTLFNSHPLGNFVEDTIVLPYEVGALKSIEDRNDIAMIFIEPFQGSNPRSNDGLINALRSYCSETGILLGFDEIISGVRYPGHIHYDVLPDIATYGKVFGGGLPIGLVAGRPDVMEVVKNGVFLGGTFTANPMSLMAGQAVLSHLTQDHLDKMIALATYLDYEVNSKCLHLSIMGVGSFLRLMFTSKRVRSAKHRDEVELSQEHKKRVYQGLFEDGLYLGSNGLLFLCTEHDRRDIDLLVNAIIKQDKLIG